LLRYYQPGYTTYDASAGIAKDNWTVEAYGTNLSNSNASTFTSSAQFIKSEVRFVAGDRLEDSAQFLSLESKAAAMPACLPDNKRVTPGRNDPCPCGSGKSTSDAAASAAPACVAP